jgi:two-component system sensor histidine kinase TctE
MGTVTRRVWWRVTAARAEIGRGEYDRAVGPTPSDSIPLRRAPTDLGPLLAGTIETLVEQARSLDVSLTMDAAPGLPPVPVDAEKIAWAVAALVGNALRYVRRGSRRLPGGSIRVTVRPDGGEVVVSVEDDGPGIPDDKLRKLFHRGEGVTHGTGLALMLIQDVVVAHGGRVDLQSRTDSFPSGTTVALRLPVV